MSDLPVALVGFMASGKSTLGRRLATHLELPFVDLDRLLEERAGKSIAAIMDEDGEPAFRRLESSLFEECVGETVVLATGGGIVESAANRTLLRERCRVLWLDVRFELVRQRLHAARLREVRPLVKRLGPEGLRDLHFRRRPLYASVAHLRVEIATHLAPARLAREVLRDLRQFDLDSQPA